MPRIIDCADDEAMTLEGCVESLQETGFDARDEGSLLHAARCLRRLGNNRTFLGDMLIGQLAANAGKVGEETGYTPQAIALSGVGNGFFLRANIWPSPQDYCFRASGAHSFVYGAPHDHNFDFLTVGYFGPGYRSDYYEYDYETVIGLPGEAVDLQFIERSALHEGKLMLYRAHRDVHSQLPPESLSVSINIMQVDPTQDWFDQYGFDLEKGTISRILNHSSTETFLRLAVGLGSEDAIDLAAHFGRHHPSERLRLASFEARASLASTADGQDAVWREAELSGSRLVSQAAVAKRTMLEATG